MIKDIEQTCGDADEIEERAFIQGAGRPDIMKIDIKEVIFIPSAIDLTGRRFGKLLVIEKSDSRNGKTYWRCQCDCGNEKIIQTCHLTGEQSTSCGCNNIVFNYNAEKICQLCGESFISNNISRKYCFSCSPEGMNSTDRIRRIDRLIKHKLIEYKGSKCERCGYDKCEGALQFHHINPDEKEFTISNVNLSSIYSMDALYQEVDKCMLLCANCHAEEHYLKDIQPTNIINN